MYDPGLKYQRSSAVNEAASAAYPDLIPRTRERLREELADYPGVLVWREELYGGLRIITATKYPESIARVVIERMRREALRGQDAA